MSDLLFLGCLIVSSVLSQSSNNVVTDEKPTIVVTAPDSNFLVAEPFDVAVTVTVDKDDAVRFADLEFESTDLQVIGIRDQFDVPVPGNGQRRIWKRIFTVESYLSGSSRFPTIQVAVTNEQRSRNLESTPLSINISSELQSANEASNSELRDIMPTIDVDAPERSISPVWITGLILGAFGVIGVAWIGRRLASGLPRASTSRQAIRRLGLISIPTNAGKLELKHAEEVHQEIEETLRAFLAIELESDTVQMTRSELIQTLKRYFGSSHNQQDDECVVELEQMLASAEAVRFAKQPSTPATLTEAVDKAKRWIRRFAATQVKSDSSANTPREATA
ncbi:MAG: hypothetical protein AAFN77_14890 [Planctomycetota bacterium]